MKNIILSTLSLFFLFNQNIFAQSYSGAESVEFDYANNRYLVSNTTTKQIIARASNGSLSVFATLSIAPYGIEIVGDTLYCCTSTSITALNLNTGAQIFNQIIQTGSVFLNGITHDPNGNLYMTGFSSKKVYRFNTSTRQSNVFVNNTVTTPNGIIYDNYDGINPRLVLAGWGTPATVKSISLSDSSVSLLVNTPFGSIDGIAKGKNGNFYISCWSNNTIQRYDSTFASAPTAMVTTGLSSPADIFYNQISDTLAVPFGSNVNFYYFGTLTGQLITGNVNFGNLFPNPSNGIINFTLPKNQFTNIEIRIMETGSGKIVYTKNMNLNGENGTLNLKENSIANGNYIFEIYSKEGILSRNKITLN